MQDSYSILMSVYIKEQPIYLKEAIDSMLNQTVLTDDFVIICDGPLTTELNAVLLYYSHKFPTLFNIIRLRQNGGLGKALNVGVANCQHELIARMDSDDISVSNRIELQLREFKQNPHLDVCGGQIAEFTNKQSHVTGLRVLPCTSKDIERFFPKRNPMNHMTVMFKKSSVIAAGNYEEMPFAEDYFLWGRMLYLGAKMKNISSILVYARTGNGLIARRGGLLYARKIVCLQLKFMRLGLISPFRCLINCFIRVVVSVLPGKIRSFIYLRGLRNSYTDPLYAQDNQKIKIAMLVPSLDYKGPVIVAHKIAHYCKENDVMVDIISLRFNKKEDWEHFKEFSIYEVGMKKIPTLHDMKQLQKIICQQNYTIVHAHAFYPSLMLSFMGNIVKFVTVHNNPYEDYIYEYGHFIGHCMAKIFVNRLKYFDEIISISGYVRECIGQPYSTVIYNGIEDSPLSDENINNSLDNTFKVVTISVLNKRKNVITVLKVIEQCNRACIKINCMIIGDGPERKTLEMYVKEHGLEQYVIFTGKKNHSYIYHILRNSHALLLTSKSEGFGLVIAEAFMCSCPVIVNNIPVMNEMVHGGTDGFICQEISEYVDAIQKIRADTSGYYRRMARQSYMERFQLSTMGQAYMDHYKQYGDR